MTRNCCGDGLDVAENLRKIRERIREACAACGRDESEVTLMAVTKTVPPERVNKALDAGVRLLGENRVQECCEKYQSYHCTAEQIHLIGHLQTNKIRSIIDKVSMIESVDSLHLAKELDEALKKTGHGNGYSASGEHRDGAEEKRLCPGGAFGSIQRDR